MPSSLAHLSADVVGEHIRGHVFGPAPDERPILGRGAPAADTVGVELEWLTAVGAGRRRLPYGQARSLVDALTPLPGGSRLTIEPGGQLELSSACGTDLDVVLGDAARDLFLLDQATAALDIDLVAMGTDSERPPERILPTSRYALMEAFFDADGPAGRTMMCNTASVQINVGLGASDQVVDRWCLANDLAPTLVAAFANSPFGRGGPSGWQSTRMRSWLLLDQSRAGAPCTTGDPIERFVEYVLDARVMLIRRADDDFVPITGRLTFGRWLTDGHELGWPDHADLAYHLTTLFPPVRPKGWFELRTIDALPTPFWQVATSTVYALLTEPAITGELQSVVSETAGAWADAAQLGVGHPALRRSATRALELAVDVLEHRGHGAYAELVAAYLDGWVRRGRSPGDALLDQWRRTGSLAPPRRSPVLPAADLLLELTHR
jgi:glutamate--cysteine ligase